MRRLRAGVALVALVWSAASGRSAAKDWPAARSARTWSSLRWRRLLLASALGGIAAVAVPATPASAHALLVGTNPAQGSVVPSAPAVVVLTFSEPVTPLRDRVVVIAPDGSRADGGEPTASGNQVVIGLRANPPDGTYLVSYRVVSADSHPIGGTFTFSIGAPSPGGPPTLVGAGGDASPVVTVAIPVVRWVGYAGLLLLVGAALVLTLLWPERLSRRGPLRALWLGVGLVGLATIGELLLQVPYVAGGSLTTATQDDLRQVLSSQYGAAHLVRLGVLAAAAVLVRPMALGRGWAGDRVLLAVLGTIGVATWSVSGHPSASPVPMATIVADMIHLASMSVWLGGLVMLVAFLLPRANSAELGAIVPVWSRWAGYAVAVLILTGVAQALVEVGTAAALVGTRYGWILLGKVALVGCVLIVAALSRRQVAPIASGTPAATRRLRAIVVVETAIAAVVLAAATVLVQTTPARTAAGDVNLPAVQSAIMRDRLFTLTVDIEPARVGVNDVHLYATTVDGQPADIKQWRVRASLPERQIENVEAAVLVLTADHATAQITLPEAGTWRFAFTLRTTEVDQSTVTADIVVRD